MNKKLTTKVTEMLGIEYPIIQGCMQWIAKAELAGAVSEAGGLGIISSSTFFTAEDLRAEIKKIKASRPSPSPSISRTCPPPLSQIFPATCASASRRV